MNKPRVLVTGGAGYIGSHTCKALAAAGLEPIAFDDCRTGNPAFVRWGPLEIADLADRSALDRVLARHQPIAVVHLAASAYVAESVRDPAPYFRNNVANSLTLLEAMRARGIHRIVFSSSCASYGLPASLPMDETHPQRPINPYGHSKLVVETMLRAFGAAYGLGWVALRYFNAAGADPDGEIGESHDPETHLVPLAVLAALGRRSALEIYGTDYATPDGSAIRDYVHVSDLADAHVLALRHLLDGGESTALNLGTSRGHSVREVIAAVERVMSARMEVRERPRRDGDPPALVADARRARTLLGWSPRHSTLEEMVDTAWRWLARHDEGISRALPDSVACQASPEASP